MTSRKMAEVIKSRLEDRGIADVEMIWLSPEETATRRPGVGVEITVGGKLYRKAWRSGLHDRDIAVLTERAETWIEAVRSGKLVGSQC